MQISSRAMIVMRWCDNRYNTGGGGGGTGLQMFAYITNPTATISTILRLIRWEGGEKERALTDKGVFGMHSWHLSTLESQAKAIVSNHIVNKTPNCYWYSASSLAALSEPNAMWQSAAKHASCFVSHILRQVVDNWNRSEPGRAWPNWLVSLDRHWFCGPKLFNTHDVTWSEIPTNMVKWYELPPEPRVPEQSLKAFTLNWLN